MSITLPTIPDDSIIEYKSTFAYTQLPSLSTSYVSLICGLPVNYAVCGTCIQVIQQFAAPSLTSLTCSLGAFVLNSTLSDATFYGNIIDLTQTVTPQSFILSGPPNNNLAVLNYSPVTALYFNGAHDISATFISHGANLNTLTSGLVEITVQIRPL